MVEIENKGDVEQCKICTKVELQTKFFKSKDDNRRMSDAAVIDIC